ncbi:MAG: leucine-rich repeat domain-containing protein [Clostridiales bacterium]|nr:leucine-rich repeat domain-containing protein [Clostridiales bacterium]
MDGKDGVDGKDGADGKDGTDGKDGVDGKSAYQIWLDNGYKGTEADFLEWLKGDGVSSAEILQYQRISGKEEYRVIGIGTVSSLDIEIPVTYKGFPVTEIGERAFYEQVYLESVSIPDSVASIGNSAFYGCKSLTSVEISDSVASIGDSAFYNCTSLTSIEIPNSVTNIGGNAFAYCSSLTKIYYNAETATCGICLFTRAGANGDGVTLTIGASVKTLPYELTYVVDEFNKPKITKVVFEEGSVCESIEYTFKNLSSLTSIEIPDSVTSIAEGAFSGCNSLTIYCEAESQPSGWENNWNGGCTVEWGYNKTA